MDNAVCAEVRRLIATGVSSMDHVDLLFHLARGESTTAGLARATRFSPQLVEVLAEDLLAAGVVARHADALRLTGNARDRSAIDELLEVYNSRPVTLVRAIYARELLTRTVADAINPPRTR